MPTVAVKPMWVAIDRLDGNKFTRLMKTWHSHVFIIVSRQEYVPFPAFDSNKTFELTYENAPECTILKWKDQTFSCEGGTAPSQPSPRWGGGGGGHPLPKLLPSALDKSNTGYNQAGLLFLDLRCWSSEFMLGGVKIRNSVNTWCPSRCMRRLR